MIDEVIINLPKDTTKKAFIEIVQELCIETEPKPFYCELPEDLKLRSIELSGTAQTYTYTSSLATISGLNTSTTTTS